MTPPDPVGATSVLGELAQEVVGLRREAEVLAVALETGRHVVLEGPPACPAGCTYTLAFIRALGRMKRSACFTSPAATSSAVGRRPAIGNPAASAEVHCSPRIPGG